MVVDDARKPMRKTPGRDRGRKLYAKPVAKRVHLKPEEAVLGFCKTAGYSGPSGSGCGAPISCSADGS